MGKLEDIETTAKIKLALMTNLHVGGLDIGVDTVNGIVFLNGAVQDADQKSLAEEIARSHGGIDIQNNVEVLGEPSDSGKPAMKAGSRAGVPSEDDLLVRDRVIAALENDSRVNAYWINVEVLNGIVRLSGPQDDEEGRRRAYEIAKRVSGVQDVSDEMEVKSSA